MGNQVSGQENLKKQLHLQIKDTVRNLPALWKDKTTKEMEINLAKDVLDEIKFQTPLKDKKICTDEKHALDSNRKIQYLSG